MAKKQTPSPYDLNATVKKRNPQDATLRNINALKKRVAKLENTIEKQGHDLVHLALAVAHLAEGRD
jgi:hypothetical protein